MSLILNTYNPPPQILRVGNFNRDEWEKEELPSNMALTSSRALSAEAKGKKDLNFTRRAKRPKSWNGPLQLRRLVGNSSDSTRSKSA